MLVSATALSLNAQEEPETILEPGELVPPYVQLDPDTAPVLWDPEMVGDFQLLDQAGHPVTRESLLGTPWIANFIFTRCNLQCPATCRKIMDLNQRLQNVEVRLVTITVDPEHDSVPFMAEYASIYQATPDRWIFATGEPENVWQLIREGFKVSAWENVGTQRVPGMEFAHDNHLIHIDSEGRIRGRYDSGSEAELTTLVRVVKGQIDTPEKHQPAVIEAHAEQEQLVKEFEKTTLRADPLEKLPRWAQRLPATNAMLNALATGMLLAGFLAIKSGRRRLHKQLMLYSFGVSVAFLICYASYHYALHEYAGVRGKPFTGEGMARTIYYAILISHVVFAALVPVLAVVTIVKGLRQSWESHRKWARVTFPIWLYVSVTGVMIYWMLYRM